MAPMIVPRALIWPVVVSTLLWAAVMVALAGQITALYHPLIGLAGLALWHQRAPLQRGLQAVPLPVMAKVILLGYLAVIAEETLAGLLHALQEHGDGPGVPARIGQFIAFNLFAFTGIIWALAIGGRFLRLGPGDLFVMAGGWGLFAEGTLFALMRHPVAAALLILPTMMVYAVILWPAHLVQDQGQGRTLPHILRVLAVWALAFVLSQPPMLLLSQLRASHPTAFPPCAYIAC